MRAQDPGGAARPPAWSGALRRRVGGRVGGALYGAWMLALAAAVPAFPTARPVLWGALALSSAGAIAVGVRVHRPARPLPWWLLAVAVTLFAAGAATGDVLPAPPGRDAPFPALADVFHLAAYPAAAGGLLLLVRHRAGGRDRGSLLDALSLTTALALLGWIFLVSPSVSDPGRSWAERATSIAYPLGDVLVTTTLARLLVVAGRNPAAALLGLGAAGLLVSDVLHVLHGLGRLGGPGPVGGAADLGRVVLCVAWAAAALHPSVAALAVPVHRAAAEITVRRIALLAGVSLVAPGVLLVDSLTGDVRHGPTIAASSAVLLLLVLVRLSGVVARHRAGVERERALRAAGADLVSAAAAEDVAAAVRTAVARLVPPDTPHRALLVTHRQQVRRSCPREGDPTDASRLVPTATLDPAWARQLPGFAIALVCPLVLRPGEGPDGAPTVGLLVVAAAGTVLHTLRGAVEVLASQAALAVERVALSREVGRRDSEAYFRTLVQNAHDVILIVGDDGRVRYASPSADTLLGPEPVVGTRLADLLGAGQRALLAAHAGAVRDHEVVRADGRRIDVEVASRDLRADPTIRGVVLTLRDVTEERRLQQELTHRAFHDPLTGLANRLLFRDRVEHAVAAVAAGRVVGVLLVDLDDFKLVNDTMGHGAGDDLLVTVADRLRAVLRPHDTAARLGGDEFAVLVEDAAHAGEVEDIAARVVDALCGPGDVAGGLTTSVSVGVAVTPEADGADGADGMLRQADLALYAAKGAGKGRWRRYAAGLHLAAVDRLQVRAELERALAAGAFELHYQPVVELDGGRTVGVEALVRWRHPRRGLVPPSDFIPFAEESGLVVPLGAWVLDRALADHVQWRTGGGAGELSLSVNVSARQVRAPGFLAELVEALDRSDTPPERLVLEITETSMLADDAQVSADLAAVRDLGVRIAVDDFGTGYSSLDYLRVHAIDILKVDRSFIAGMERSGRQSALVGSIVALARALGLHVVAEGVETVAQRDALVAAGCHLGQGHLFSVAVPAGEITRRLRAAAPAVAADTAR